MNWSAVTLRLPTTLHEELHHRLERLNHGQSVPVTLNEYLTELIRAGLIEENPMAVDVETRTGERLTLHAAIAQVLEEAGRPLTFGEIRETVIRQDLYREGSGAPPSPQQIRARVENYAKVFYIDRTVDPHRVSLQNLSQEDDEA